MVMDDHHAVANSGSLPLAGLHVAAGRLASLALTCPGAFLSVPSPLA